MKESRTYLENAERCAHLADLAPSQPAYRRFMRMEAAWRALALEQRVARWRDTTSVHRNAQNSTCACIAKSRPTGRLSFFVCDLERWLFPLNAVGTFDAEPDPGGLNFNSITIGAANGEGKLETWILRPSG